MAGVRSAHIQARTFLLPTGISTKEVGLRRGWWVHYHANEVDSQDDATSRISERGLIC